LVTAPLLHSDDPAPGEATRRLARLRLRAQAALWWERLWPRLAALASLAALFVALAWFGLFLVAPVWARAALLALFALAGLAILFDAARWARPPGERETLARLDRDSQRAHRPVTALADTLADDADPATRALWRAHRARAAQAAQGMRVRAPSPRLVERDRFALRAAAGILLVAAGFVAGPQKQARLLAAFDLRDQAAVAAASRIDAFLDPPAYTGRPPIVLATRVGEGGAFEDAPQAVEAPAGSQVVIRAAGAPLAVAVKGGLEPAKASDEAKRPEQERTPRPTSPEAAQETRLTLAGDARLTLSQAGRRFVFDLKAIADQPPNVALTAPPQGDEKGLLLSYRALDDYGVEQIVARFSNPVVAGKPVVGRTLVEPPNAPLPIPPGGSGEADGVVDMADHPWAGARVTMTLAARDGAGQEAVSPPIEVTLPARVFTRPLARALVEQRRDLVLSPDAGAARVDKALSALKLAPDLFGTGAGVYLGLSAAQSRLRAARSDDDLRGVADLLWEMALRIEEGDLSKTRKELQAAQQALREAMERGASPEEMKKLMEDLRAAMDRFLQEFAQRQGAPQAGAPPPDARVVTRQDLDQMLKQMEEAQKRGDVAEAQRLLDQLEQMMKGLRQAQPSEGAQSRQMGELDKMTREQQRLRDDTFRKDRRARRNEPRPPRDGLDDGDEEGAPSEEGDQAQEEEGAAPSDRQLAERQKALRDRLDRLQEEMKRRGLDPEQGLDDAEQAMRDSERELDQSGEEPGEGAQDGAKQPGRQPGARPGKGQQGQQRPGQGQPGSGQQGMQGQGQGPQGQGGRQAGGDRRAAIDAQGRALEGLRRGIQGLQRQMQGQQGEGQVGEGEGGEGARQGSRGADRLDPLDRPRADSSRRPQDQRGLSEAARPGERARRVQEELRRRLGEPARPQDERDYYERLLKPR
jgi:uncharacterized protein (TIGR02302 family)